MSEDERTKWEGILKNQLLKDEWSRFFYHWFAATFGFWLIRLLASLMILTAPDGVFNFPRAGVWFAIGAIVNLLGGAVRSNVPPTPNEMVRSMILGASINLLATINKFPP